MKKLSLTLIIILFSTSIFAHGKDTLAKEKAKFGIDYFAVPAFFYNSLTLGFNYQPTSKIEHCLKFDASLAPFGIGAFTTGACISYNLNFYYGYSNFYLPIWLGIRNIIRDVGYEEGYFPHMLNPSIGTGFGYKANLFKKNFLRFELIGGASLNYTNDYPVYPFTKLSNYSLEKRYPVIPTLRIKLSFVREF